MKFIRVIHLTDGVIWFGTETEWFERCNEIDYTSISKEEFTAEQIVRMWAAY